MAVLIQDGNVIDWINDTGDEVVVNSVVDLTTRVGVAQATIADGDTGAVRLTGVFEETATTANEIAVGDQLYWSGTELTTTSTDNTPVGMATTDKAATAAGTVQVRLG